MTPDVNVLVAASRSDHPHHATAYEWLTTALSEGAAGRQLVLMPMAIASFLRLVTHPRIFVEPTPIAKAIAFVDAVIAAPGVQLTSLGPEWQTLRQLALDGDLKSNDIPDAWLAAAVIESGEHLVTFDRDFKKLLRRSQLTVLSAK